MSGQRARSARRLKALRDGFWWGYTGPDGCQHTPHCHPDGKRCIPQPKQALAHASDADVLFYGGAIGGGKTEMAIVEAVAICIENPNVQVAMFRRFHEDLKKNIVTRLREILPDYIATYNSQDHAFYFWNGSIAWMCHCRFEDEVYRYQGLQVVALFMDEASHFTEFQVRYLMTRVRSTRRLRKRVVFTSNPGNIGHGWLKRWFIRPTPDELGGRLAPKPLDVWRPLPGKDNPTPAAHMKTRQFIPAYFRDNFALVKHDPHYLSTAYELQGDKAKQLAEGDWDANDSMIVGAVWHEKKIVHEGDIELLAMGLKVGQIIPWHVIPNDRWRPSAGSTIWGSVDYGFGAPWAFHLHALLPGGHVRTWFEFYEPRKRDEEQAQMIRRALLGFMAPVDQGGLGLSAPEYILLEPIMWNSRKEMGIAKSIAEVYADELGTICQMRPTAAGRAARVSRPQRWLAALSTAEDGLPNWTVTTGCPNIIRTVPEVPWDPKDPEVEDDLSENHCIAEGTLVDTIDGAKPIERIVAGDYVLTRRGYRQVLRAWQTYADAEVMEVTCADGRSLRATANHRVWVQKCGYAQLGDLSNGLILHNPSEVSRWLRVRSSFLARLRSGAKSSITSAATTSLAKATAAFIAACGRTSTVASLTAATSTIRMRTSPTITPSIWNFCPESNTARCTLAGRLRLSAQLAAKTCATPAKFDWLSRVRSERARCAADRLPWPLTRSKIETTAASSAVDACTTSASVRRSLCAWFSALVAATRFERSARVSDSAASSRVTTVRPSGRAPVYDLTVADAHEFFAGGILVHNCYEGVGRFFEARPFRRVAKRVDPYEGLDTLSRQHHEAIDKARKGTSVGGPMGLGNLGG